MDPEEVRDFINSRFEQLDKIDKGQSELISMLIKQFMILSAMVKPLLSKEAEEAAMKEAGENMGKLKAMVEANLEGKTASEMFGTYGGFPSGH